MFYGKSFFGLNESLDEGLARFLILGVNP